MLFNSYEFIFAFLPATIAGFLLFGARSRAWALGWLIVASVVFYAWWRPFNLLIIGPSLVVNFVFGRILLDLARDESRARLKAVVLTLGIVFNLAVLGYFKYATFAVSMANDIAGTDFVVERIILPLGISFITFQKIAFLVDVAGKRIEKVGVRDFILFVMFFPQLIAGPIVHYREMMPQFQAASCKFDRIAFATGLTLFCFGLFKKVVLADTVALQVSPIFQHAADGDPVSLVQAWQAAIGFTLQIYFDFSAYSDMACGAALLFGIRLPLNFDSPLKATNIIDFWLRWHVTLTRFLTAYVYNPITLAVTRRRAAKRMGLLRARNSNLGAFVQILAAPTVFTMLVSGVWHGAGYTFVVWGLIHGFYLVVNHAWRQYGPRPAKADVQGRIGPLLGFVVTFIAVAFAMVFFRAPDIASATNIAAGMAGFHGFALPDEVARLFGVPAAPPLVLAGEEVFSTHFASDMAVLGALLAIALLAPNSLQVLSLYQPVLQTPTRPPRFAGIGPAIYWRPTLRWLVFIAALAAISVTRLSGESEFLYWQF